MKAKILAAAPAAAGLLVVMGFSSRPAKAEHFAPVLGPGGVRGARMANHYVLGGICLRRRPTAPRGSPGRARRVSPDSALGKAGPDLARL